MESLFKRQKTTKGFVLLMLAGSLVVHGGLAGIGALLERPEPEKVIVDWEPQDYEGPTPTKMSGVPEQAVTPETALTASPEAMTPEIQTPAPAQDESSMAEPSTPTPRLRTVAKPVITASVHSARLSSTTTFAPGGSRSSATSSGPVASGVAWVMPHPPYPAAVRRMSLVTGSTTVRVTTDAAGRISDVTVVRSAGNPLLDAHTVSYVREHWHGPANAARTTEFVYQVR